MLKQHLALAFGDDAGGDKEAIYKVRVFYLYPLAGMYKKGFGPAVEGAHLAEVLLCGVTSGEVVGIEHEFTHVLRNFGTEGSGVVVLLAWGDGTGEVAGDGGGKQAATLACQALVEYASGDGPFGGSNIGWFLGQNRTVVHAGVHKHDSHSGLVVVG